jgi:hypothetical protein
MSQETTDNFWAAIAALKPLPPPVPVFYRLYHDDQGRPLLYTMEDLPGNYIDVDRETYVISPTQVRVVDGKLVRIHRKQFNKLRPGTDGTPCAPNNVSVVVDSTQLHTNWSLNNHAEN